MDRRHPQLGLDGLIESLVAKMRRDRERAAEAYEKSIRAQREIVERCRAHRERMRLRID